MIGTFNPQDYTIKEQKAILRHLKNIHEGDGKPKQVLDMFLSAWNLDDIRVIYPTKEDATPKSFAFWENNHWHARTYADMLDQFINDTELLFPEVSAPENTAKNALSQFKARLKDTRTSISEWDVSDYSLPLADRQRSICLKTGEIIDTPKSSNMLTAIQVSEAEIATPEQFQKSRFKEMLDTWFPDECRRHFAQMAFGQGLARNPSHTILDCWGVGRNGKGALFKFIEAVVGDDYLYSPSTDYFIPGLSRHEAGLCPLETAKFAVIGEFEPGAKLSTSMLKSITGSDKILVSEKGGRPRNIKASALPVVHGNSMLNIKDKSKGFWRRYKRLNFLHQIPDDQEISDTRMNQIAKNEKGIVLYWLLEGLKIYQVENGGSFGSIPVIDEDTQNVRAGLDSLMAILHHSCEPAHELHSNPEVEVRLILKQANEDADVECPYHQTKTLARDFEERGFTCLRNNKAKTPRLQGWVWKEDDEQKRLKANAGQTSDGKVLSFPSEKGKKPFNMAEFARQQAKKHELGTA